MVDGVRLPTAEGTPQGPPLSPLLSNIMPDDLDRELWARGHRFVRYADDLRVFVRSERAAQRVLASVTDVIEQRLKLKVNQQKSSVRHASQATLLGFGFSLHGPQVRITVAPKAVTRRKNQLRTLTGRRWSVTMDTASAGLAGSSPAGWPISGLRTRATWSARRTGGCADGCGRSAGRNGRPPPHGGTTCEYAASPSATSANGAEAVRDTGGSRAPRSSASPCPTPTGNTSA